ncbi:hypothetical protein KKC1_32230, partial [Calderihabitans maritimus]
MVSDGGER